MARVDSYDTIGILTNALGVAALRHDILANNVANIDTPGYKRSDISFQFELQRALSKEPSIEMQRTSPHHLPGKAERDAGKVKPRVFVEADTWTRNDKNNVDPEAEMAAMAQNTMYYQALANRISAGYRGLTGIINKTQGV